MIVMTEELSQADRLFGTQAAKPAATTSPLDEMAERLYGATSATEMPATPPSDPAARLFGGPDAEPASTEARQPRTDEEMQKALYPEKDDPEPLDPVPPDVQAIRDLPERRMYSAQDQLRDAIPDPNEEALKALGEEGITPEFARKSTAEVREIAADLDLGKLEVQTLRQRAQQLSANPVEVITQREAAVDALNREFGNQAAQAWRDARALVARDPRVGRMIEAMGVGDDAETVLLLARAARSQRVAGKLKVK